MRKLNSITLAGPNTSEKFRKGTIEVAKGKVARGQRFKMTIPLANASGGPVALTDAQKQSLFGAFFLSMAYGAGLLHKVYQLIDFVVLQILQRHAYGSEMEGYADSTTGLAQSLPNGATTNCVCYPIAPTGRFWQDPAMDRFFGVGPTQARMMEIEIRRGAAPAGLPAGVTIGGIVTLELIPDEVPAEHPNEDRWSYLPEYRDQDEADKVARAPADMQAMLLVAERTAKHVSSTLTNIRAEVGPTMVHDQVSPAELITEYHDAPNLPAEADVSDRWTLIYVHGTNAKFNLLPVGRFVFTQLTKDLATAKMAWFGFVVQGEDAVKADLKEAAIVRAETIKAINFADTSGKRIPYPLRFASSLTLVAPGDADFDKFPGTVAEVGKNPEDRVPASVLADAKARQAKLLANGEVAAAAEVAKKVAAAIPGAVTNVGGAVDTNASATLARIRQMLQ